MSKKVLLQEIAPYQRLYRDPQTGIAWVEDGTTGTGHSAHPNIDASGSIRGMKANGYWQKDDVCVRSHGFIFNVSRRVISGDLDQLAADACQCAGCRVQGNVD